MGSSVNQINLESCLFESLKKGFSKLSVEISHSFEDFDLTDVFECFSPLTLVKLTGSKNDVVSAILCNKLNSFHVILLNELSKVSADDLL